MTRFTKNIYIRLLGNLRFEQSSIAYNWPGLRRSTRVLNPSDFVVLSGGVHGVIYEKSDSCKTALGLSKSTLHTGLGLACLTSIFPPAALESFDKLPTAEVLCR